MTARSISIVPSSPLPGQRSIGVFIALVLAFSCLAVLMFATGGMMVFLAGLLGAAAIAWATWRWPVGAAIVLAALGPINRFVILLMFNVISSPLLMTAVRLWDDALVSVLVLRVAHDAFCRRTAPRVMYLDLLVISFIAISILYVFYPGTLEGNSFFNRFNGFRFDALFLLAYFAGRGIELERRHVRWLVIALLPTAIAVAVFAVFQWALPSQSETFFNALHYDEYMRNLGASGELFRTRDLSGMEVPRVSSLVTGDLTLSYYQMFMIPFAAGLFFVARKPLEQAGAAALLLAMLAVVILTVTRSAIAASVVGLIVVTLVGRGTGKMTALAGVIVALALAFLLVSGLTPTAISGIASPEEGSAQEHASRLTTSVELLEDDPLGRGLATAGPLAQRELLQGGFTNESWYLQIATEIGLIGAALFATVVLVTVVASLISTTQIRDPWLRALTIGTAGSGLGFLLVGVVLHVWEFSSLSALFWLMAGITVRAPRLEAEWMEKEAHSV
jgi:O-Antigen ligase